MSYATYGGIMLLWSEELYAVQCEATGRRDHGLIEPRWFSISQTESIRID